MLQGGISVNRYHRLRACKKRMKERYAKKWHQYNGAGSWNQMLIKYRDEPKGYRRYHPLNYWRDYYLTGPRQYAKFATNRKLRQMNRKVRQLALQLSDLDDCGVPMKNADYRKQFDYDWTIW